MASARAPVERKLLLPPALIENALEKLAKVTDSSSQTDIACPLNLGTNFDIQISEIVFQRNDICCSGDTLHVMLRSSFRIGFRRFHYAVMQKMVNMFDHQKIKDSKSDQIFLVQECLQSLLKEAKNICTQCLQFRNKQNMQFGASVCDACQLADALCKMLPEEEQKINVGINMESDCAICKETFTPTSVLTRNDQCDHVFHHQCFCVMRSPKCPLCKTFFTKFQRSGDGESWYLIDEEEIM